MKRAGIIFLLLTVSGFAEEIPQSPFTFKPKLDIGFEYQKDFATSINPGVSLGADFNSGTGKKIGFELSYNFTLKEFITETNVIADNNIASTDEIRDYTHALELSMSNDITTKLNLALAGDIAFYRVNTYEQVEADSDAYNVGPKIAFTGITYTKLSFKYTYSATSSVHSPNSAASDEYAFDSESQREMRGSVLVYPYSDYTQYGTSGGTDSFFVGLDDTFFEEGEEVPTFEQVHDFNLGVGFDMKRDFIPSASLGYDFIPIKDSNNDGDDGFGHTFAVGLKEQLWPKAKLGLDYKLGINGYDNQTDDSGEFMKFSYPNRIKASLSQDIMSWLSASAAYEYKYTASNESKSDGKENHKLNVGFSAFF